MLNGFATCSVLSHRFSWTAALLAGLWWARRFHAALGSVTGYAIDGEVLTLEGPEGPVARFERYLE